MSMLKKHQPEKVVDPKPVDQSRFHTIPAYFKLMNRSEREKTLTRLHAIHAELNTKESENPE